MDCPVDRVAMRRMEDKGVVMDWCDLCDGIWLDAGELTRLTHTASDIPSLPPAPKSAPRPSSHRPSCPRCRRPLEEIPYTPESSLLVDRCPQCRGFWLERGELQTIYDIITKQRSSRSASPPAPSDPLAVTVLGAVLSVIAGLLLALLFLLLLRR